MLSIYIEFLLRHGASQSADETLGSGAYTAKFDVAEQRDAFLSEAEKRELATSTNFDLPEMQD